VSKEQLITALMETPAKLGASLRTYHQAKRRVEQLEAQLSEMTDWSTIGPPKNKSKAYKKVEQQLKQAKVGVDTAEEELTILQAQFEVYKVLARLAPKED